MRKFVSIAILAVLPLFGLVSCGGDEKSACETLQDDAVALMSEGLDILNDASEDDQAVFQDTGAHPGDYDDRYFAEVERIEDAQDDAECTDDQISAALDSWASDASASNPAAEEWVGNFIE